MHLALKLWWALPPHPFIGAHVFPCQIDRDFYLAYFYIYKKTRVQHSTPLLPCKWSVKKSKHFEIITFTSTFIFSSFQVSDFCHGFWHLLHILFSPTVTNAVISDFNNSKATFCGICIKITIFNSFYASLSYWLVASRPSHMTKIVIQRCRLNRSNFIHFTITNIIFTSLSESYWKLLDYRRTWNHPSQIQIKFATKCLKWDVSDLPFRSLALPCARMLHSSSGSHLWPLVMLSFL